MAEAVASAEPRDAPALAAFGRARVLAGDVAAGLNAFDRALWLQPGLASAHAGRGLALAAAGRGADALVAYQRAAELDPADPAIFLDVGRLLLRMGWMANACAAFGRALELKPDDRLALEALAKALMRLDRHEEALSKLSQLLAQGAGPDDLTGCRLHAQLQICDWAQVDAASAAITERVRRGEPADSPFAFLAHSHSPADQRHCAEAFVADRCTVKRSVQRREKRGSDGRLRIGYLSADLRQHAVGQLLAGVFESHDRRRFETYAYCACADDGSSLRRRLKRSFDRWVDVSALQDVAVAALMAEHSIDIAVDLGGHTTGSRTRVLAHRPAPVQVAFLGFPATLGAAFIDYIVADRYVIPEAERVHYAEQVIYLPDSYLPHDRLMPPEVAPTRATVPTRAAAALPPRGVVYCCFNAPYKISPFVFETWTRVLRAVPESVLWMREASPAANRNLRAAAAGHGIDPPRLIFAATEPDPAQHLARMSLADIFLDTHPYNAHTTAADALAAGLPVITLRGRTFASRVATSLLNTVGLGELSVETPDAYVDLAIELGGAPERLGALKSRLRSAHATAPLFDPVRFCRHLETAFLEIHARYLEGEAPAALWVDPCSGSAA
jgi:protein O-GlcNAc transferase